MAPINVDWTEILQDGGRSSSSYRPTIFDFAPWPTSSDDHEPPRGTARRYPRFEGRLYPRGHPNALPEAATRRPAVASAAKVDCAREEGGDGPAAKKSRNVDTEKEGSILQMLGEINKSVIASLKSADPPQQVPKEASPEEIFGALKGIPKLARLDLLRAYSMLIRDDRQFRSLMALPKGLRKDWLLMEIENK